MTNGFQDLGLSEELLQTIDGLGYEEPTPIQSRAIPLLMAGRDVIAQAQTGTGKTAAFAIPIVERVDPAARTVQAVVVLPTRELAVQVAEAIHALGRARRISVLPIYGGQAYEHQTRALRAGAQVVVGTPGRMMDLIRRELLRLDAAQLVILDEADEMLDMGFLEDIEFILEQVPAERQIGLFSATFPVRIEALARRHLRDPERVSISHETATVSQTRQWWYQVPYQGKLEVLTRLLDFEAPQSAMIFCRTKREVDSLSEALEGRGFSVAAIHGDITQSQRTQQLRAFREGRVELLIATDVAARGIDVPEVSHVFNYDIPDDGDAYVHRIGRTGRMGRKGEAITLVTPREFRLLRLIEHQTHKKLKLLVLPTEKDIAARRRDAFREALRGAISESADRKFGPVIDELLADHDLREIAAAAMHLANGGAPEAKGEGAGAVAGERATEQLLAEAAPVEHGMVRLFVGSGRKQGLRPQALVQAFGEQGVPATEVGAIALYDNFAFAELRPSPARAIIQLGNLLVEGKRVHVKKAVPKDVPARS